MPRSTLRRALSAGALCLTATVAIAPTASAKQVGVAAKRLNITAGGRVSVVGRVDRPGTVKLQIQRHGRWVTIDRDRTDARGRYAVRARVRTAYSGRARVRTNSGAHRAIGRVNVYRQALASWYGPGLYGNNLACGGRLHPGQLGVANKSLPCGTMVTFRHRGRVVRVPVIDRGPFAGGREYDLTQATAQKLGWPGPGAIQATR
jgi:rare lipoprotein A